VYGVCFVGGSVKQKCETKALSRPTWLDTFQITLHTKVHGFTTKIFV